MLVSCMVTAQLISTIDLEYDKSRFAHDTAHINVCYYRKVPKFSDARNLCCNLPKIQTKRPKLRGISSRSCKLNSKQ